MGFKKDKDQNNKKDQDQDREDAQHAQTGGHEPASEEEAIPMVMLPAEEVEGMKSEIKKNLENWQRERADFLNYKRRIEREQLQLHDRITGDIIKKILPAIDDLERALNVLPDEGEAASWGEGIDLIYRKLKIILEAEGVTKISAGAFDPNIHEAITLETSPDHESGEIIEIVQQGYMLGDRVLRPAQVRVAQ